MGRHPGNPPLDLGLHTTAPGQALVPEPGSCFLLGEGGTPYRPHDLSCIRRQKPNACSTACGSLLLVGGTKSPPQVRAPGSHHQAAGPAPAHRPCLASTSRAPMAPLPSCVSPPEAWQIFSTTSPGQVGRCSSPAPRHPGSHRAPLRRGPERPRRTAASQAGAMSVRRSSFIAGPGRQSRDPRSNGSSRPSSGAAGLHPPHCFNGDQGRTGSARVFGWPGLAGRMTEGSGALLECDCHLTPLATPPVVSFKREVQQSELKWEKHFYRYT
ncbi:hypothetical protein NDU88_004693 [Pleurodeles waltl]|uniref:Uncharacterized protein n=1 Tax=Pleurodeles waltl TaxID=8319 RepID=A0AAV7NN08_PLEWA|nr:hypothetical protein NDU88_004693 [Pleurodeles waltl]